MAITVAGVIAASQCWAQSVFLAQGDVFYRNAGGIERRLTASGTNRDLCVSPGNHKAVFVEVLREHPDLSALDRAVDSSRLVLVDLASGSPRTSALLDRAVQYAGLRSHWFTLPRFSPDGKSVYFLVPGGAYKGHLIVWQNPQLISGGRYDVFNMIDGTGAHAGVVSFDEAGVESCLADRTPAIGGTSSQRCCGR